ncbi:hypothetical protein ABPG77_008697, partial [Micractinium sp. CCAP 211/92]
DNGTLPALAINDLIIPGNDWFTGVSAFIGSARIGMAGEGIWVPPGRSAFVFAIGSRKSNYNAATSDLYSNITIKAVSGGPVTSPECYFQLGSGVAQGTQVFQAQTWPGHGGRCPSGVGGTSIILSRPDFWIATLSQNARATCVAGLIPAISQGTNGVLLAPLGSPCLLSYADIIRVTATAPMLLYGLEVGTFGPGVKLDQTITFRIGVYSGDSLYSPIKWGGVTIPGNTYVRDSRSVGFYRHSFSRTLLLNTGETAIMYMSCTLDGGSNVVDRYVMIRALIARPGG